MPCNTRSKLKLDKIKITEARYQRELSLLLEKGFTEAQANSMIIKECSEETIDILLHNFDFLMSFDIGFSLDQMAFLASLTDSKLILENLLKYNHSLNLMGYCPEEKFQIASSYKQEKAIVFVVCNHFLLRKKGYSNQEIVDMMSDPAKFDQLKKMVNYQIKFRQIGFREDFIEQIVSRNSNCAFLDSFLKSFEIFKLRGYTNDHIKKIVESNGPDAIGSIIDLHDRLLFEGYPAGRIIQVAFHGGMDLMVGLVKLHTDLKRLGYPNAVILADLSHCGLSAIPVFQEFFDYFKQTKHTPFFVLNVVRSGVRSGIFEAMSYILSMHNQLLLLGFKEKQIVTLSLFISPTDLGVFIGLLSSLQPQDYSCDEVLSILYGQGIEGVTTFVSQKIQSENHQQNNQVLDQHFHDVAQSISQGHPFFLREKERVPGNDLSHSNGFNF